MPGEEESFHSPDLEGGQELARVDEVVLHRIAVSRDDRGLEAGQGPDDTVLNIWRQRRGNPIQIEPRMLQSLGLDEDLMAFFVGKADHFVLDGRTVPRTGCLDLAGVHRRAVQVRTDQLVGDGTGICNVTEHLRERDRIREDGEGPRSCVADRWLHLREIDGVPGDARRGTGLEPAESKSEGREGV